MNVTEFYSGNAALPPSPPDPGMPRITFPEELPISAWCAPIQAALQRHPVTIVCGDTGSGKTTQLPKMALALGRAARGRLIACTQPRRLATTTVAARVAAELNQPLGGLVGYQHRFDRKLSPATRIKFMTDGVLLAETRRSPRLSRYDTIIIDEAHERSLNIDLLLGWTKHLIATRRDLRLIISSATLDAGHFADFYHGAPVIEVPGRLFPIDIRYRETDDEDSALADRVAAAVAELAGHPPGDILVFLPGERDINETATLLREREDDRSEIIPLLATLPAAEQQRAFRTSSRRRIILATNVAETSLTLPNIRYVIDSGLARLNRYLHRAKVQRLQIEPISQASARQRAGRCGRTGPGTCIRLYSEDDFKRREAYTIPEIRRSNLAGVILTMLDLRLGDISSFPFLDPPAPAMIKEGYRELFELGAIRREPGQPFKLTTIGWQLTRLPVDPRLGRILLAGEEEQVLHDILTLVAALACDDPRQRPFAARTEADRIHATWHTPTSDFAARLRLWRWWEEQSRSISQAAARRLCRSHYLSWHKMREWRDLRRQLATLCQQAGFKVDSTSGGDDGIHRALLTGLLGRIGQRDPQQRDYRGAHDNRFAIFPGSALAKKPPAWVVAAELVETSRLFAREVAAIDPAWLEPLAGDLCQHSWHSPWWDAKLGFVRALERVTLFGLTLHEGRRRDYSRIDPPLCRDLFIRHALIAGELPNPPPLLRDNQQLLATLRQQEAQLRLPGRLLDEERLATWFDGRLPPEIVSANQLRHWLRRDPAAAESLRLSADEWLPHAAAATGFPETLQLGRQRLPLTYRHNYGADDDGITCTATIDQAPLLSNWPADWLVPGALPAKVAWLLQSLPAVQRRLLGPLDEATSRCLTHLRPGTHSLASALAAAVRHNFGLRIAPDQWAEERCPDHLRIRFLIVDRQGKPLASGRDLAALLRQLDLTPDAASSTAASGFDHQALQRLTSWSCGPLPATVESGRVGWQLLSYPALVDKGDCVAVELLQTAASARAAHRGGLLRLMLLSLGRAARPLTQLPPCPLETSLMLQQLGYPPAQLADDLARAVVAHTLLDGQPEIRTPELFATRLDSGRHQLPAAHHEWQQLLGAILATATACRQQLDQLPAGAARDDMLEQLAWLIYPGFVRLTPWAHLQHLPRYLEGILRRCQRLQQDATADARRHALVAPFWQRYRDLATSEQRSSCNQLALANYRWLVEEYRISTFAQELKTPVPISPQRLEKQWQMVHSPS